MEKSFTFLWKDGNGVTKGTVGYGVTKHDAQREAVETANPPLTVSIVIDDGSAVLKSASTAVFALKPLKILQFASTHKCGLKLNYTQMR